MWNWMGSSHGTAELLAWPPSSTQLWPTWMDTPVGLRASLQIRGVALLQRTGAINWDPELLLNGLLGKYHLALQTASGHLSMAFLHPFGKDYSLELMFEVYQLKTTISKKMQLNWGRLSLLKHLLHALSLHRIALTREIPSQAALKRISWNNSWRNTIALEWCCIRDMFKICIVTF